MMAAKVLEPKHEQDRRALAVAESACEREVLGSIPATSKLLSRRTWRFKILSGVSTLKKKQWKKN